VPMHGSQMMYAIESPSYVLVPGKLEIKQKLYIAFK